MLTEQEFRPKAHPLDPHHRPAAWVSSQSIAMIDEQGRSHRSMTYALFRLAAEGRVRTWAQSLKVGSTSWSGGEVPAIFWEQTLSATSSWREGRFEANIGGRFVVRLSGVWFLRADLEMHFPKLFRSSDQAQAWPPALEQVRKPRPGGRRPSEVWPEWVAELVAYIHENGYPDGEGTAGTDLLLAAIADRLAKRGMEAPSRSTLQPTARAVLLRLRALPR